MDGVNEAGESNLDLERFAIRAWRQHAGQLQASVAVLENTMAGCAALAITALMAEIERATEAVELPHVGALATAMGVLTIAVKALPEAEADVCNAYMGLVIGPHAEYAEHIKSQAAELLGQSQAAEVLRGMGGEAIGEAEEMIDLLRTVLRAKAAVLRHIERLRGQGQQGPSGPSGLGGLEI